MKRALVPLGMLLLVAACNKLNFLEPPQAPNIVSVVVSPISPIPGGNSVDIVVHMQGVSFGLLVPGITRPAGDTLLAIENPVADTTITVSLKPDRTTDYLIIAEGPGGTAYANVTVTVIRKPTRRPTASLATSADSVEHGSLVTLVATVEYADSALLFPLDLVLSGGGGQRTTDTVTVTPARTTTFLLIAVGPGGTAFSSVTVYVAPPPVPVDTTFLVQNAAASIVDGIDDRCCSNQSTDTLLVAALQLPTHVLDSGITVSVQIERSGVSQLNEAFAIGMFEPGDTTLWIPHDTRTGCPVIVPDDQSHQHGSPVFVEVGRVTFAAPPAVKSFLARHAVRFRASGGDTSPRCYTPDLNDPDFRGSPNSVMFTRIKLAFWRQQ